MKKYFLLATIIIIGLILSGCSNYLSDQDSTAKPASGLSEDIEQPKEPDMAAGNVADNDLSRAKAALLDFFNYLSSAEYAKALPLFSPDSWEVLENYSLAGDRNDKAKVLENYCRATGTCLPAKVIKSERDGKDGYNLVVQFTQADGSLFVLGPCCGATEEEMPSQDKFDFLVKKIDNTYLVISTPLYRP